MNRESIERLADAMGICFTTVIEHRYRTLVFVPRLGTKQVDFDDFEYELVEGAPAGVPISLHYEDEMGAIIEKLVAQGEQRYWRIGYADGREDTGLRRRFLRFLRRIPRRLLGGD